MPEYGWSDLAPLSEVEKLRSRKPRKAGLTMVIDKGVGLSTTKEVIEIAGDHIDHWKCSFGTSAFIPKPVLRAKLELLEARGILTFPGGTLFEACIIRQHCRLYMQRASELGFRAVEISDGTIDLPLFRRRRVIACALEGGLRAITEVGKKDPARRLAPAALAEQALDDLENGAEAVIIEGRESGKCVGIFDRDGEVDLAALETIADTMDDAVHRLIWEAPLKKQQTALIRRFGTNVSLGNIEPERVLALEALRAGLRFETFQPIADALVDSGEWRPDRVEPPLPPAHGGRLPVVARGGDLDGKS